MTEEYERILTVKPEVLVYKIPPRPSNRGYRAADWGLDKPSWTGRLRIVAKGSLVTIKLEDKTNGELFAKAPVTAYPSVAVESVTDSSRYFVIKIADDSGRTAFIGIGFADRGDAFDFNVTLQDHFNSVKKDKEIEQNIQNEPALNLQLKEGQTFKINLGGKLGSKPQGTARPRTNAPSGGGILLPPPPGGAAKPLTGFQQPAPSLIQPNSFNTQPTNQFGQTADWGEFASAQSTSNKPSSDPNWVQF